MLNPPPVSNGVDLSSCDREPIHYIGAVQPHGALLAADADTLAVSYASANLHEFLGIAATDVLARPLAAALGADNCRELLARPLAPLMPDLLKPWFITVIDSAGQSRSLECYPHLHGGHIIIEFVTLQRSPTAVWEQDLIRQRIIAEMIKPDTVAELAQVGARIIRDITGFDRVMIYRFAEDHHGEVIAESTSRADSFLGLHYPAADIPEPARRHFLLNVIRAIPDINAPPVPILSVTGEIADATSSAPLDLTYSKLRGVAPVHIEYLNNMGVQGSMSISLTANDALWGLVACHHYGALYLPSSSMRFAELVGGTISALLQSLENAAHLRQSIRAERVAFDIEQDTRASRPLRQVINAFAPAILGLINAQGMLAHLDGEVIACGQLPMPEIDASLLCRDMLDGVATCDHLQSLLAAEVAPWDGIAGAAYLELSDDSSDYLVLFREHFEQTIKWAGRPDKIEQRMADGVIRLTPRGSFEMWREERRGRSRPFSGSDKEALRILRRALFALNSLDRERRAVLAHKRAEEAEGRMRMALLDAMRKNAMGELAAALAHELNQPLFALSNYVNACRQELLNYGLEIPARVNALFDDAVGEAARAGDLVRRLRNFIARGELAADRVDINTVVRKSIELALASNGEDAVDIVFDLEEPLPHLWLDPIQIGQVIVNLVSNSLAAMRDQPQRTITISSRRYDDFIEVAVADTGVGVAPEAREHIFEPFHSSTTSGMGIGLSLCRTIVAAHKGRIWLAPSAHGAQIVFSLPLNGGRDEQLH